MIEQFYHSLTGTVQNKDPLILLVGLYYLFIGISLLTARRAWEEFMAVFQTRRDFVLSVGLLGLPFGLAILLFYDIQGAGIAGLTLWILGWLITIKAALMTVVPTFSQEMTARKLASLPLWLRGVVAILLSLILLIF